MTHIPRLQVADAVTPEHGAIFAEEFFDLTTDTEVPSEAFAATRLIVWPGEKSPAIDRYDDIADTIRNITFELTRRYMAEVFCAVAKAVLDRERSR
jgi:hypothetical protein